ncbi:MULTISPECIES: RNA-guided endonuclease InsQ/TnpB family protein [unclassified Streptomyces]|uniref:RNA-guided endonuclease InsQ/TnpB family protein n=1 Tax=unclassified Streptomyces TaxID=2593676 RepID=UPI0038697A84|nr:transposase [Streptomyces sp. NBC_01017]WSV34873.1 transposase [Streptomyces sp. NBC_01017]
MRHERGRWFVSLRVETAREITCVDRPDAAVGIDLGVKHLAVLADSTGQIRYEPNPRHLDSALRLLRLHSRRVARRQGPDRRSGRRPSKRWEKANADRNRVHHRVANLRTDALHKLTTCIRNEYGTVVVEDLNAAGMLRNRRLARHVADAGFGKDPPPTALQRPAQRVSHHRGRPLVPQLKNLLGLRRDESQTAAARPSLHCDLCSLVIDRDENAARNLAALAAARTTGPRVAGDQDTPRVSKPRGADRETRRQHPGPNTGRGGRADGANLPHQRQRKRETVVRTPKHNPRRGDTDTDLPDGNIWKAESH